MPRIEKDVTIQIKQGMHARPAALFVQIGEKYSSDVIIVKDGQEVNGKSIMGILMLGAENNSKIKLIVDGPDADELVSELETFLSTDE